VAGGALAEAERGDVGDVAAAATSGKAPMCEGDELVRAGNGIVSCVFGEDSEAIVEGRKVGT